MVSSRDLKPEGETADVDGGEERFGVFCIARGDAAPSFEHQECIFDQVAQFVEVFVIGPPVFPVFLRRDDGAHTLNCGLLKDGVGIISVIRDQMIGVDPLDQAACLRAIRAGTFCNNDSDRHTKRIHGQMYFGVEPPFVRLRS